jgi:hypothetical protein
LQVCGDVTVAELGGFKAMNETRPAQLADDLACHRRPSSDGG